MKKALALCASSVLCFACTIETGANIADEESERGTTTRNKRDEHSDSSAAGSDSDQCHERRKPGSTLGDRDIMTITEVLSMRKVILNMMIAEAEIQLIANEKEHYDILASLREAYREREQVEADIADIEL